MADEKQFAVFPAGPRWLLSLTFVAAEPGELRRVALAYEEGNDTTSPREAFLKGADAVYILGEKIPLRFVALAVHEWFAGGGPSLLEVYRNSITAVYLRRPSVPLAGGPVGEA